MSNPFDVLEEVAETLVHVVAPEIPAPVADKAIEAVVDVVEELYNGNT